MKKEWLIKLFLLINKFWLGLFSVLPQKKKFVFLCDFGDNAKYTIKSLNDKGFHDIIILKTKKCHEDFSALSVQQIIVFDIKNSSDYMRGLCHIATCKKLLVDNYFPQLSVLPKGIECIQLWHAAGAVKKFALSDPSIAYRTPAAIQRLRAVYERMDKIVVGSETMSKIFRLAFHKEPSSFIRSGVPRTDFYFDLPAMEKTKESIYNLYPQFKQYKTILYAPTFRDGELATQHIPINFEKIIEELGEDYLLIIKLHPAVLHNLENINHPRIVILNNDIPATEILTVIDMLISDYSSIPFEFAYFNKPQIFYPYDLDQYRMSRGFWHDYAMLVPGPVVDSDDELVHAILHLDFNAGEIEDFCKQWNLYSKGNSSEELANYLLSE